MKREPGRRRRPIEVRLDGVPVVGARQLREGPARRAGALFVRPRAVGRGRLEGRSSGFTRACYGCTLEAMKARQAVVCPACGALNRPTWEFCARCNESLEGAKPSEAPAGGGRTRASLGPPSCRPGCDRRGRGSRLRRCSAWPPGASSRAPRRPAPPDPGLFTFPTRPARDPPGAPRPRGRGAADFDAGRRLLVAGDFAGAVPRLAAAVAADPVEHALQGRSTPTRCGRPATGRRRCASAPRPLASTRS